MPVNVAHNRTIGRLAVAIGVVGVVNMVTIILLYALIDTVGSFFGTVNDLGVALQAILCTVLAWMLRPLFRPQSPRLSLLALASAIVGTGIVVVGSALVISDVTSWFYAGLFTIFGNALIGFWLVATNHLARRGRQWPHRLTQIGLVTGSIMMIGLLTGPAIFTLDATQEFEPWWVYLGYAGGLGWFILLPAWSMFLGRVLLSQALAVQAVPTTSSTT